MYYRVEPTNRKFTVQDAYTLRHKHDAIWVVLGWYGEDCDVWEVTGDEQPNPQNTHSYQISNEGLMVEGVEFAHLINIHHIKVVQEIRWVKPRHFTIRSVQQ